MHYKLQPMAEEIKYILTLSDEERTERYGTKGWKLLIETFIDTLESLNL